MLGVEVNMVLESTTLRSNSAAFKSNFGNIRVKKEHPASCPGAPCGGWGRARVRAAGHVGTGEPHFTTSCPDGSALMFPLCVCFKTFSVDFRRKGAFG